MQKRITIRVDAELFQRLGKLAGDRPIAEYCRDAISAQVNVDAVNHNLILLRQQVAAAEQRLSERLDQVPVAVVRAARGQN